MSIPNHGGNAKVIFSKSTVLYEKQGRIHHVHHTTILEGGHVPSEDELAKRAHECARRIRPVKSELSALHVDSSDVDWGKPLRVDSATKRLVAAPKIPPK